MKASILAVGTELTTGQITNRNAAWLSDKLAEMGVETVLHEAVADDRAMIRSALDRCRELSELVFVTGGLGPTTDDFTREVIAEWLGKPLQFVESSWKKIETRLTRLGIRVAESNRQQCYFPEGSEIIVNTQGTADAFSTPLPPSPTNSAPGQLWVIPGPPREVGAVWTGGIEAQVRARVPELKPRKLLTWQCIGKSEAELGEITERALAGSGLQTGYRAHRPYVEIKVWIADEDMRTQSAFINRLDSELAPWIATRQGSDLAKRLLSLAAQAETIDIADSLSGGILAERLGALLRETPHADLADSVILTTEWTSHASPEDWIQQVLDETSAEATLTLAISGFNDAHEWAFGLRYEDLDHVETGKSPYPSRELLDRSRRYAVEFALKRWCEWLEQSAH